MDSRKSTLERRQEGVRKGEEQGQTDADHGHGIQQTRDAFASSWFCETGCSKGLQRLGNYRKKWNKALGCWSGEPMHDDNSHGADGYRQFGQTLASGEVFPELARASAGMVEVLSGAGVGCPQAARKQTQKKTEVNSHNTN